MKVEILTTQYHTGTVLFLHVSPLCLRVFVLRVITLLRLSNPDAVSAVAPQAEATPPEVASTASTMPATDSEVIVSTSSSLAVEAVFGEPSTGTLSVAASLVSVVGFGPTLSALQTSLAGLTCMLSYPESVKLLSVHCRRL